VAMTGNEMPLRGLLYRRVRLVPDHRGLARFGPALRAVAVSLGRRTDYLLNLTTIAPMRSPFLKSFFGLLGWAL
jgi:hypothetical protein